MAGEKSCKRVGTFCQECGYSRCQLLPPPPRMIEVPLEAFALLFAYCHTSQVEVPDAAKRHPDYPDNRDFRLGHLTKALRPYAQHAFAALSQGGRGDG